MSTGKARHCISDNNSGVHPAVMQALHAANTGNTGSYGDDPYTEEACALLRHIFGDDTRAFFVFLGTAANVLALQSILKPYEGVICAESAHINTDECGAMEATGHKIYGLPHHNGKVRPEDCMRVMHNAGSVHHVAPRVLSISQGTEYGVLYTPNELRELAAFCKAHNLYLHMDGARIANAAAAQQLDLRAATRDAGVDIMTFGGTKNGLMFGEAVLIFNPALAHDFAFYRKRGMQLGSKMRFISTQFVAYLKDDLWLGNARQANAMTARLAARIATLPGVRITRPAEVNAIFVRLPHTALAALERTHHVAAWDSAPDTAPQPIDGPEVRIMTSFNTTEAEIDDLAAALHNAMQA